MPKSATSIAKELLESDDGGMEELRIHEFENDDEAHDDEAIEKLYADFSTEFARVEAALSKQYGKPARTGKEDDEAIPLSGVFKFVIWTLANDAQLFAAAAHEDREAPILLVLGMAD